MSASHFGTFPVKTVLSRSVMGNGILTSTARIVAKEGDGAALVPDINSEYEFDSRLWVTQADLSQPGNGFDEITITAMGPAINSSTTVEVQPGGPLIWGLGGGGGGEPGLAGNRDFPSRFGNNLGISIKVSFVDSAGQESALAAAYQDVRMPESVRGVALPVPAKDPGPYETSQQVFWNNQNYALQRLNYLGFVVRDLQMQRMGSALAVSVIFKEAGRIEQFEAQSQTTSSYRTIFEA